jgi:hypothetical protein
MSTAENLHAALMAQAEAEGFHRCEQHGVAYRDHCRWCRAEQFDPTAAGRFWVLRNGRVIFNMVRQQADVLARGESADHPRSTVQIVDAATGVLVATWVAGEIVAPPA